MMDYSKLPCRGKFCGRPGLPILPLRVAYVPQAPESVATPLQASYGRDGSHARGVHGNFTEGRPVLRVITEGYVFTYDPRRYIGWRAFAATPQGRFMEVLLADDQRPKTQPSFNCTRDGDNLEASLINVERPQEAEGKVWVGYTRVWWTKAIRKHMLSDPALRDVFMVPIDAKGLYAGEDPEADLGFRVDPQGSALHRVLEYQPAHALAERLYANTRSPVAQDRAAEAAVLARRMHHLSPHGGIVLALPDPVGLAADTAYWRNIKAGELTQYAVAEADMRSRLVGDLILGLKQSLADHGQTEVWEDRYAPKLDMARLEKDKAAHDRKIEQLSQPIYRASTDWLNVVTREVFWRLWQAYDGTDRACGLAMERDFSRCVEGSGALEKEQAWWQPWLLAAPDDAQHPLWRALAAGDKDVLDYLGEKVGDGLDTYKNAKEGLEKFKAWLEARKAQGLARASTDATGVIAGVVTAQLPRLIVGNPDQVQTIGARLRVLMAVRTDTVLTPYSDKISVKALVALLYETAWGPPSSKMSATLLEARRALITQDVDGAFIEGRFTSIHAIELDLWLPETETDRIAGAARLTQPEGAFSAAARALPKPALNPFQAMRQYLSRGEAKIVGLGGALALFNLVSALDKCHRALRALGPDADEALNESLFGVVSGTLAVGAVIGEATAGVLKQRVAGAVAQTVSRQVLRSAAWFGLVGGLAGAGAAWTEAVNDFCKAYKLSRQGDKDARFNYLGAGWIMFVSGFASAATALIGASELLAASGATGTLASMVISAGSALAFIPVWGWIALGIVALAAGIYLTFKAMTAEDTPLEIWLSRCYYRGGTYASTERKPFATIKEEMAAFQRAIYGLQITLQWHDAWFQGKDEVEVQVLMPGYGEGSDHAYALQARGNPWAWQDLDRKASALSRDPDLQPREQQLSMSAIPPGQQSIPMEEVIAFIEPLTFSRQQGMALLKGRVALNPHYLDHVRLKFEYWPDAVNHPELDMTPQPNGINFEEVRD